MDYIEVKNNLHSYLQSLTFANPSGFSSQDTPCGEELERPVTPINEEIKTKPTTFRKLAKYVRRRLKPVPNHKYLGEEDQLTLAAVIIGQLSIRWSDFHLQATDPFLSSEENHELLRRITVHVVLVIEKLFSFYVAKAYELNDKKIFSEEVNLSRLKAQLALDARKYLNVLTIRRYILDDIKFLKGIHSDQTRDDDEIPFMSNKKCAVPSVSYFKSLVQASRTNYNNFENMYTSTRRHNHDINNIPSLDAEKLSAIVKKLPLSLFEREDDIVVNEKDVTVLEEHLTDEYSSVACQKVIRSHSVLNDRSDLKLYEELGLEDESDDDCGSCVSMPALKLNLNEVHTDDIADVSTCEIDYEMDAQKLIARATKMDSNERNDIPPLLQTIIQNVSHDHRMDMLLKQKAELDALYEERIRNTYCVKSAKCPQPDTMIYELAPDFVVKTSDLRVSERICLSSIALDVYPTIYNDLIGEIDQFTIKKMDSNLYEGGEFEKVYEEIMKTLPVEKYDLFQNGLSEPCATHVDFDMCMTSFGKYSQKEFPINPELFDDYERETKSFSNEIHNADSAYCNSKTTFNKAQQPSPSFNRKGKKKKDDRLHELVTADKYFDFLSSQNTDFLSVVFRLNQSDENRIDSNAESRMTQIALEKERSILIEKKVEEAKSIKNEFSGGLWNCNSVLMGGLGKDPEVNVEPVCSSPTPSEIFLSEISNLSRTKVFSRKSTFSKTFSCQSIKSNVLEDSSVHVTPFYVSSRVSLKQDSKMNMSNKSIQLEHSLNHSDSTKYSIQRKLESIWNSLLMSEKNRLDMAMKYSSEKWHMVISEAIESWLEVTNVIIKRENLIYQLENFERDASNPGRFFEKKSKPSDRLEEEKTRHMLHKKIEMIETQIKPLLKNMRETYQENVSYEGRDYENKMKWDKIEMLYWLHEERRLQKLNSETIMKLSPNNVVLQPILT